MTKYTFLAVMTIAGFASCKSEKQATTASADETTQVADTLRYDNEVHLKNVRQLTFGGDNAEAATENFADGHIPQMVSTGKGRTTCSYFLPGNESIIYASTHLADDNCPPEPKRREDGKYVWPIYESFDIFTADLEGNIINQLTDTPGYDAEPTVSPKGDKIFSPDGSKLIFRSSRPKTPEQIKEYKDLLKEGLVKPTEMELYVCNADGSDLQKITDLGNANWAPFFHPSGKKVLFSSNHKSKRGFPFNLFMINVDGTGLEQITFDKTFDSFPMFSFDGKQLIFASNRFNGGNRSTNLFLADWVE